MIPKTQKVKSETVSKGVSREENRNAFGLVKERECHQTTTSDVPIMHDHLNATLLVPGGKKRNQGGSCVSHFKQHIPPCRPFSSDQQSAHLTQLLLLGHTRNEDSSSLKYADKISSLRNHPKKTPFWMERTPGIMEKNKEDNFDGPSKTNSVSEVDAPAARILKTLTRAREIMEDASLKLESELSFSEEKCYYRGDVGSESYHDPCKKRRCAVVINMLFK